MRTAFLFPGQGVAIEQVAACWHRDSAAVRRWIELASEYAGVEPDRLFERGARALVRTELLQPVHIAVCLGIHEELNERGVRPGVVAGHSLGEVAAYAVAGCLTLKDAIHLAATRGRLMAREASLHPGGMVAIPLGDERKVEPVLAQARDSGMVAIAAYNSPAQIVVSAETDALRHVCRMLPTTPVPVAGPWHNPAMAGAVDELLAAAASCLVGPILCPVISNRTGDFVNRAEDVPRLLAEQLTHPIQWTRSMQALSEAGVTDLVIVGAPKPLRGLVLECLGEKMGIHTVATFADLGPCAAVIAA